MTPAEFVAHDALTFWVGVASVLVPLAGLGWLARRRLSRLLDRFCDWYETTPDQHAAVKRYARSQMGKPYVYGSPMQSVPDDWFGPDGRLDREKVAESVDAWDEQIKGSTPHATWFDEFPGYQPPE